MALNIGELAASIRLNTQDFTKGLKKAQEQIQQTTTAVTTKTKKMGTAFRVLGRGAKAASLAIAAASAAAGLAGKQMVDAQLGVEALDRQMIAMAGSAEQANKDFAQLRGITERLGTPIEELTQGYVALAAASKDTMMEGQNTIDVLEALSMAGSVLGKSGAEMDLMFRAVSQAMSKGVIQSEEMKGQLSEHLPMALGVASRALGVTTQELNKMMESGALQSQYVWPLFAKQLRKELGGAAEAASKGLAGAVGRMKMAWWDLMRALVTGQAEAKIGEEFSFMEDLVGSIRTGLQAMVPFVIKMREGFAKVREYFAEWGPDMERALTWMKPLGEFLWTVVVGAIKFVLDMWRAWINTISTVVEWFRSWGKETSKVGVHLEEIGFNLKDTLGPVKEFGAEAKKIEEPLAKVVDYTKQISDVQAAWGKKFAGLERSLTLRMTATGGDELAEVTTKIEQRREVELEKIKTFYATQRRTLQEHQALQAAAEQEYERLRVRINEAANLELEQAQADYYAKAAEAAEAAAAEKEALWERENQILLGILQGGSLSLTTFFDEVFTDAGAAFENFFTNLIDEIYKVLMELMVIRPIMESITGAFKTGGGGGGFFEGLVGGLGSLFGVQPVAMAGGGTITEPIMGVGTNTGTPYMFGEGGPERVTPLGGSTAAASGGSAQYNITIQAMDTKSASDFMQRNPGAILGPVTSALQRGNKGLLGALRSTI